MIKNTEDWMHQERVKKIMMSNHESTDFYFEDGKVVIITGVNKKIRGTDKNGKPRVPWRYANVLEPKYNFTKSAGQSTKQQVVDSFVNKLARKIKKYEKGKGAGAPAPDPQGPE